MTVDYIKGKLGWRFVLYTVDGLDFCKSIWFATKEVCESYASMLIKSHKHGRRKSL